MKKILALVVAAGLALAGNAAALDWKYSATADNVGETVYVMLGADAVTSWASLDAVKDAAVNSGEVIKSGRTYFASGSFTADAISDVYYVVVSADQSSYSVSTVADMSASVYYPENQGTSDGQNSLISSSSQFLASGVTFGGGGSDPITPAIPEPTSGLLMLVGLGALALRRRRA